MSLKRISDLLAGLLLLGAAALPASAAVQDLVLGRESRLWLEGDSTLHPFSSTATRLNVSGGVEAPAKGDTLADLVRGKKISGFRIVIPVAGLKSGEAGLDKNMHKALKADQHPEIIFELTDYQTAPEPGGLLIKAAGRLSAAGVEKPMELEAHARPGPQGLEARGAYELLMTDYGVKPPAMMLGAIKTRNRVVIRYDIFINELLPPTAGK
jgi:hypothetical protein